jgi:hypothetical protein
VADIFRYLRRPKDESGYFDWLQGRESDIADQPHWLEVEASPLADEFSRARQVTAKTGDSISRIIGTSDPSAIGAFGRANGLKPGDSTVYAGKSYVVPTDAGGTADDRGDGLLMIHRDNTRLARLRAQREAEEALVLPKESEVAAARENRTFSPQDYLREWISEQSSPFEKLLDRNPLANRLVTGLVESAGRTAGAFRGAHKTAKGLADLADRVTQPYPSLSDLSDAVGTDMGLLNLANQVRKNPGLVPRAVERKRHELNVQLNPSATAPADTALEELGRRYGVARNQGEPIYDVVSAVYPGTEVRQLNGMNRVREILRGPEFFEKYGPASRAALAEPAPDGMGSHFIGRAMAKKLGLPQWFVDGPFNVSRPPGQNKGERYLYHSMVDPKSHGDRLPTGLDRRGFRFRDFGVERFSPWERLLYGAPGALKGTVGGTLGAAAGGVRYAVDDGEPTD